MKLNLIKTNEPKDARMISTRVEKTFEINPVITVVADCYVGIHTTRYSNFMAIEVQDWETTYFIGGEECKTKGVKELLNTLFSDLSYDKIEASIREFVNDEVNFVNDFLEYDTLQGLSEEEASVLLEQAINKVTPTVNSNVTFIYNWEIKTLARLANDPRLQTIPVLTDYDLKLKAQGRSGVAPSRREVLVLSNN